MGSIVTIKLFNPCEQQTAVSTSTRGLFNHNLGVLLVRWFAFFRFLSFLVMFWECYHSSMSLGKNIILKKLEI